MLKSKLWKLLKTKNKFDVGVRRYTHGQASFSDLRKTRWPLTSKHYYADAAIVKIYDLQYFLQKCKNIENQKYNIFVTCFKIPTRW